MADEMGENARGKGVNGAMEIQRDSLDILFRRLSPELLKDTLLKSLEETSPPGISAAGISFKYFNRYSHQSFPDFTSDEIENIHRFISQRVNRMGNSGKKPGLFHLLTDFTRDILYVENGDPVCEKQKILAWRSMTLRLGQDLFTTAHLAKEDSKYGTERTYFAWPHVIRSNSPGIRELMNHGLSENHSHLNGAVPVFHLSWISLMNHPEDCFTFQKDLNRANRFQENLEPALLQSYKDYQMPWSERIQLAAWIRAKLFFYLLESPAEEKHVRRKALEDMKGFLESHGDRNREVCSLAEQARFFWGRKVQLSNGKLKIQVC